MTWAMTICLQKRRSLCKTFSMIWQRERAGFVVVMSNPVFNGAVLGFVLLTSFDRLNALITINDNDFN